MRYFVTGTAGFIGFHVAERLLAAGHEVVGVDGMTPYYDVTLKQRRSELLARSHAFTAHEIMLEDMPALTAAYEAAKPDVVIHLAAQAGVRYSLENPRAYIDANVVGTFNILELARAHRPRHLLFASTSSVYGANPKMPFHETDRADCPLTLYAATKKATEAMAHAYAHLWAIPSTALRFFTVYGPWGRPDMALFKFTKGVLAGEPIDIYNNGEMLRDFTYVDDIAEAIIRLADVAPSEPGDGAATDDPDAFTASAPFRVVNIGNGDPVRLLDFVEAIEASTGRKAIRNLMPMQPGDVPATYASADLLFRLTGFRPETPVAVGVERFVRWYADYYGPPAGESA
ncbi:NAD-dependent epimerase [Chenggangzhangella methanolivorans]|uniref:NAD-dependent epimerase n=1 Tax=Chenggangzhangella methanolivorans TaxID=1437009 RepID=A0A9E6R905_9HYPH|nr:NAD-dependent epimerase [Chenggangzhangella methanolivorans]QZN99726.1 NAD-dependent epimerase [Chenggangzhangella methanolivorans]